MLTLRRNAREIFWVTDMIRAKSWLCFVCMAAWCLPASASGSVRPQLSARQRIELTESLQNALRQDPLMPSLRSKISFFKQPITFGMVRDHLLWIIPFKISYPTIKNSYCRLAVLGTDTSDVRLVSVPATALNDACAGLFSAFAVETRGDSGKSVALGVWTRSARAGADVQEAMVFVSDDMSGSGLCYSHDASAQLFPEDLISASTVLAALNSAKERLGIKDFSCQR